MNDATGVSAAQSYVADDRSKSALWSAAAYYARGEVIWLWRTGQRRWIPYAAVYELAKFGGLQLGRRHRLLPRALKTRISAYPGYWHA